MKPRVPQYYSFTKKGTKYYSFTFIKVYLPNTSHLRQVRGGGRSTVAWYGGTLGEGHMEEDSMVFGWCRWWIMEARALLDEQVIWGMFGSVWHVVMMFKMQQDLKNPQLRKA